MGGSRKQEERREKSSNHSRPSNPTYLPQSIYSPDFLITQNPNMSFVPHPLSTHFPSPLSLDSRLLLPYTPLLQCTQRHSTLAKAREIPYSLPRHSSVNSSNVLRFRILVFLFFLAILLSFLDRFSSSFPSLLTISFSSLSTLLVLHFPRSSKSFPTPPFFSLHSFPSLTYSSTS